ncbi:MAG: hypothetical protein JST55_07225 [Bacteroidetes bacterium]|nr:hypothetical protein [Bacteroidota bacterium]
MKQFKELFRLFISLDFRDKEKAGRKKIIGLLTTYLLTNGILSFNNFNGFNEFSFAALSFSINIFFIAFVVLNDFDNLFLAKNYFEGLVNLPVQQKNFFAAKFASASLMIFFYFAVSSVSQLIFFYLYTGDLIKVILFLTCSLLFNFTFMGVLLFLYVMILNKFAGKSNAFVYVLQMIFFAFILFSSTTSSKAIKLGKKDILELELVRYLPQVFFAKAIYNPVLIPLILLVTVLVYFGLYKFMSARFFELHAKISKIEKKQRKKARFTFWNEFIHKHLLRNNIQTASYDLLGSQLRNSKFLRTKYFPMLLFPVIFCLLGIFIGPEFLAVKGSSFSARVTSAILLLSPSITMMTVLSVRMLYSNTRIADEHSQNSEMIFKMLPIDDPQHLNLGILKFIYFNLYFPLIIVMSLLLIIKLDPLTITINLVYITSAIYLLNTIFLTIDKRLPFTLESSKFSSATKFAEVMFNMLLGALIFIIQIFVFQNVIFVIGAVIVFIGVSFLINRN